MTFSEFVMASLPIEQILTHDKLFTAFKMFDYDGGGK